MTPFAIVLATQALDALGLALALGHGREANPIMAALLASAGIGAVLAVKLGVGAALGIGVARVRPSLAPWFGLAGCVGCLSALRAVLG